MCKKNLKFPTEPSINCVNVDVTRSDVLVIGAGLAGLRAGIEARKNGAKVIIVSKGKPASFYKQSATRGVQAVLDKYDDEKFVREIIEIGLGEVDENLAEVLAGESKDRVEELGKFGVKVNQERVAGCFSDTPRAFVIPDLDNLASALTTAAPEIMHDTMIIKLLTEDGRIVGALGVNKQGKQIVFNTQAVIIAAGGGCGIYNNTLTVPSIVGSSAVLAREVGAQIKNMEFSQFMIGIKKGPDFFPKDYFMRSPSIYDSRGKDLLSTYYNSESLPVAYKERSHHFPFSTRDSSKWIDIAIARASERQGARIKVDDSEYDVAPFGHASNGGIVINAKGETTVQGLYACGEASTGMHGADRMGGAMVTSALVFGARAGRFASEYALTKKDQDIKPIFVEPDTVGGLDLGELKNFEGTLRQLMTSNAMVAREPDEIGQSIPIVELMQNVLNIKSYKDASCMWKYYELKTIADYSLLLLKSILNRKESKGPHYLNSSSRF